MLPVLPAGLHYVATLQACLSGNYLLCAVTTTQFLVRSTPLVADIAGAGVAQIGEEQGVVLDGGGSYDPDQEAGALSFLWECAQGAEGGACYSRTCLQTAEDGGCAQYELLADTFNPRSSEVEVQPLGGALSAPLEYTFTLTVTKGGRQASTRSIPLAIWWA